MARAGVNYVDITDAAEAIKNQGKEPTVDRIREYLGTGSKSTIAPLLKRWRSKFNEKPDISDIPNDLIQALKALYKQIQTLADQKIEQARLEFKTETDQHQLELNAAINEITLLTDNQENLQQRQQSLSDENSELKLTLESTKIALASSELQEKNSKSRLTELKSSTEELKQENRDIRDHFEHYQQSVSEDRQQERELFRISNQQLQEQLTSQINQLTRLEKLYSEQTKVLDQNQADMAVLQKDSFTLKEELNRKAMTINSLSEKIQYKEEQSSQLTDQLSNVQGANSLLTTQITTKEQEVATLKQALKHTKEKLKISEDLVILLTDENKEIQQDKAMLKGQLTYFERTLK